MTGSHLGQSAIGTRLREARERAGFSQTGLAARLRLTQPTLSLWETGHRTPAIRYLPALADTLALDLNWLILGRGYEPPEDARPALKRVKEALSL